MDGVATTLQDRRAVAALSVEAMSPSERAARTTPTTPLSPLVASVTNDLISDCPDRRPILESLDAKWVTFSALGNAATAISATVTLMLLTVQFRDSVDQDRKSKLSPDAFKFGAAAFICYPVLLLGFILLAVNNSWYADKMFYKAFCRGILVQFPDGVKALLCRVVAVLYVLLTVVYIVAPTGAFYYFRGSFAVGLVWLAHVITGHVKTWWAVQTTAAESVPFATVVAAFSKASVETADSPTIREGNESLTKHLIEDERPTSPLQRQHSATHRDLDGVFPRSTDDAPSLSAMASFVRGLSVRKAPGPSAGNAMFISHWNQESQSAGRKWRGSSRLW